MGPEAINMAPILMGCAVDGTGPSTIAKHSPKTDRANVDFRDVISPSFEKRFEY
jgi:hypothetical protein